MQVQARPTYRRLLGLLHSCSPETKGMQACWAVVVLLLSVSMFGQQPGGTDAAAGLKKLLYTVQEVQYVEPHNFRKGHIVHTNSTWIYVLDGAKQPKRLVQGGQNPQWSHDGSKIAFLWQGTSNRIEVMNADGSGMKSVANVPILVLDFAWSPVEEKIAYCEQSADGRTAIVVVNADGSGRTEITKLGEVRCAVGMPTLKTPAEGAWQI